MFISYNIKPKKILIIGSGPIVIGQAAEFDYSGTQACMAAREERVETVLVNSNPATIQTDPDIADKVYIEPLQPKFIEKILEIERPDGILATAGGQTGLNLASKLFEMGILQKYNVRFLGTDYKSIQLGEDRGLFKLQMEKIGQPVLPAKSVSSVEEGMEFVEQIGFPVILRVAFTLGGTGGNTAFNFKDLKEKLDLAIKTSPVGQVLLEKSVLGWGEFEYEMLRDHMGNKICVCNMENIDPMGVHTGESMVIAPSQTLSDQDHQKLRTAALEIVESLNICGGCNVQFAFNRDTGEYYVIEVNPRLSRSSALASKATGYPIARVHTKIALGKTLPEITNDITGKTAFFEPALDYVVIKIPRWPDDKFPELDKTIGVTMKSTGEVMAIGRSFEEAMYKAIVSLDLKYEIWGSKFAEIVKQKTDITFLKNSPENLRIAAKFETKPEISAFLAKQGVGHYISDEEYFSAQKVYKMLGFDPFVDFLVTTTVDFDGSGSAPYRVDLGKSAHGIIYNPKLDKYAVIQPILHTQKFLSVGGFVNNVKNPLGWIKELEQEVGLMPEDLDFILPLAKLVNVIENEGLRAGYETIFYYAETTQNQLQSSSEGQAVWLSLEEIQNQWSGYYEVFEKNDRWLYSHVRQLLTQIDPQKLQSIKSLQKQNLPLFGEYIRAEIAKQKSPFENLQAVLFDMDGVLLSSSNLSFNLKQAGFDVGKVDTFIGEFFSCEEFTQTLIGQKDLKQILPPHLDKLDWSKTVDEFLDFWFETDGGYIGENLLVAKLLQNLGIPLYIATNQEKHRLKYLVKNRFSLRNSEYVKKYGVYFKDYFASCRLGALKSDPMYFKNVAEQLRLDPKKILLIDDNVEFVKVAGQVGLQTIFYQAGDNLLAKILPLLGINLNPNTTRLKSIFESFAIGVTPDQITEITHIHPWFTHKLYSLYEVKDDIFNGINCYKMVDTCAGEFEAKTPYFYSTHGLENEATEQLYYQFEPNFDYLIDKAKKDGRELVLDAVVLNQENKVFVQKRRAERKFLPNCWGVIGGHFDGDSSIKEGLNKIIQEETGWQLDRIISLLEVRDWEFAGTKKRTLVFDVSVKGDLSMPRLQLDKVNGFLWISKNELPLFYENQNYNERLMYHVCKKGLEMHNEPRKVIILGSGPIRIGQGVEFDYLTVHAVQALQKKGIKAIIINNNPETVSTDYSTSDRLYFEPLTPDFVEKIVQNEKDGLLGVIVQFGGQTAINLAEPLQNRGIKILGTTAEAIHLAENRQKTGELIGELGYRMPDWRIAWSRQEVLQKVEELQYPVLLRPSFVLGGEGMRIVYSRAEVLKYLDQYASTFETAFESENIDNLNFLVSSATDGYGDDEFNQQTLSLQKRFVKPLLIDQFLDEAIEVDIDFISDGEKTYCFILEQLDKAGIHSGDSACVFPAQNLSKTIQDKLVQITRDVSKAFGVIGIGNLQCAIKDGEIFVIEVNPRASRTVPFVSKCLGFSLTELATNVILGDKLPEFDFDLDYYKNPEYAWSLKQEVVYKEQPIRKIKPKFVAIKWPVFCLEKLTGVSQKLGPLMKSTGEAMTVGKTFDEAYRKWTDPDSLGDFNVYLV